MLRYFAFLYFVTLTATTSALAGEEILYQPAPAWISMAEVPDSTPAGAGNLLILDEQFRIEDGQLWNYIDIAMRVGSPQELTEIGTINATWLPDKGDLFVHEISIRRGDQLIDVVAQGERLEILRREQELEQRTLDGMLTATLPVPGLQVGDVLRLRYSTTVADQALGKEVQKLSFLPRKPDFRPGFARVRGSWPDDSEVLWRVLRGPEVAEPTEKDGYRWLEIGLPLDKADEMPHDAPGRYHLPAMLQAGTFADWQAVSRVMAPYYEWKGAIAANSQLAERVAGIRNVSSRELERAVVALALVQDEIAYLANGMDGGNYLPQMPAKTWDLRYGDCKAKTLLLLAILGELKIEAEAVIVAIAGGDAIPRMLPMPGAFNHVIVRARIDGNSYWLDGTGTGANLRLVGNVPHFRYGLPLRASGAELEAIEQVLPRVADSWVEVDFDQSAGVDMPVLYKASVHLYGSPASMLNALRGKASEEQLYDIMHGLMYPSIGGSWVTAFEFGESGDRSELRLDVEGLMPAAFEFEGTRGEQYFNLPGNGLAFSPDRARRQWRDIPVLLKGPFTTEITFRYHLPNSARDFTLRGPSELDLEVVGVRQHRRASVEDGILTIHERLSFRGGEIPPSEIAAAKRQAANLQRNMLLLVAPEETPRRWQFAGTSDRKALAGIEAAYATLIEREPDEVEPLLYRGGFRELSFDFDGALEDYTAAIEMQADAHLYAVRAGLQQHLGRPAAAVEDAREAWNLEPNSSRAMWLARMMADAGDVEEAISLLEDQDGDEVTRRWLDIAKADLSGMAGRPDVGFAQIEQLLADRPDDPDLLNAKCWHMGAWKYAVDQSVQVCTQAVEVAVSPGPVLDSRALAYLRTGDFDKALSDANAALAAQPYQHATLLLRGLIRLESGDPGGSEDVRQALARAPELASEYARYGFDMHLSR